MFMWQLLVVIGLGFLILEMFTPAMFFLNFAIAAFITAIISIFFSNINLLMVVFVILSLILMFYLRPVLMRKRTTNEQKTGMGAKYVGKSAKVIETITQSSGVISIYDERWDARTLANKEIPVGKTVKIVKYDSLIMLVEE